MKFILIFLFLLFSSLFANQESPFVIKQNIFLRSGASYPVSITPLAQYLLNASWTEVLGKEDSYWFKETYLRPSASLYISPYTSYFSISFDTKFLQWLSTGVEYKRSIFHKSAILGKRDWSTNYVLTHTYGDGKFKGADIFIFKGVVSLKNRWFAFKSTFLSELWNVDIKEADYIYVFQHDAHLYKNQTLYLNKSRLDLLPMKPYSLSLKNSFTYFKDSESRDNIEVGFIKRSPDKPFSLAFWAGLWVMRDDLKELGGLDRVILSMQFNWNFPYSF